MSTGTDTGLSIARAREETERRGLRRGDVLFFAAAEDDQEFQPIALLSVDECLARIRGFDGIERVCTLFSKNEASSAFCCFLHQTGTFAAKVRPGIHKQKLPPANSHALLADAIAALSAQEKTIGQVVVFRLSPGYSLKPFRKPVFSAREFRRDFKWLFEAGGYKSRLPSLAALENGVHVAIVHSAGIFIVRI